MAGHDKAPTNEFYVKNRQSALALPTFFHMYPHNQRLIEFRIKEREAEADSAAKSAKRFNCESC
jgi:hypothetical protein